MKNSIKNQISYLAIFLLLILSSILSIFTFTDLFFDKKLLLAAADFSITTSAEQINKKIIELEHSASNLALVGELFYGGDRDKKYAEYTIKTIFESYPVSLGGGIWFEPYVVNPAQKFSCVFAFRDSNNNVLIDKNADNGQSNYLMQNWYKEISSGLSKDKRLVWSKPYYDNQGSYMLMTTVGAGIYDKQKLIGISTVDWKVGNIIDAVQKTNPTENSFALFVDKNNDYIIAQTKQMSFDDHIIGHSLKELSWYSPTLKDKDVFEFEGMKYVSYLKTLQNGMTLIVNIPENELYHYVYLRSTIILILLFFSCLIITQIFYLVLKKKVSSPIELLIEKVTQIGAGNLDVQVNLDNSTEFAQLSHTLNNMTLDIKQYIKHINDVTREKEKIQSELSIAHEIQYSVLPSDYFNNVKEMNIYATMQTAKEVGGDLFDFFFLDDRHFMFLVADVAGKGITASLVMMTTKALIKSSVNSFTNSKERIENINKLVCESNKYGLFVTMFAAIVDITTGEIDYINCGHNPPLIKKNGRFEYLKICPNLVLGISSDFKYTIEHSRLEKGDILFLYTDGVTEAFSETEEQYGEKRLIECLNSDENRQNNDIQSVIENVFKNVKIHATNHEQSDDITMLAFRYNGKEQENMIISEETLNIEAKVDKYPEVCSWLEANCEKFEIPMQLTMKLELVTEEIFVNIASYAYPDSDGSAKIRLTKTDRQLIMVFEDNGELYNPLTQTQPDINLELEQRTTGGLGIFMVKQTVDEIGYQNIDDKNILTIKMNLS